jgi:hypothetical protein
MMKHTIAHDLDLATAKKAVDKAWESYQHRFAEYNPSLNWQRDTYADVGFSVKGVSLKGSMEVAPRELILSLDVPFLFRVFQGKAVKAIEEEVQAWIVKARNGEI